MKDPAAPRLSIDSHSSFLNNQRIQKRLIDVDATAIAASTSLTLQSVNAYYSCIEQLYINLADVIPEDKRQKIEEARANYNYIMRLLDSEPLTRNRKTLQVCLQLCKSINYLIISGLQDFDYFFRIGNKQTKGLNNVQWFLGETIFKRRREVTDGRQDEANFSDELQ